MKEIGVIFKANFFNKGYNHYQLNHSLSEKKINTIDQFLPYPAYNKNAKFENYNKIIAETKKKLPILPCVAYSCNFIENKLFVISIGCYWSNNSDEEGRFGIRFWHSLVFKVERKEWVKLGFLLSQIVVKYTDNFQELGDLVSILSTENSEKEIDLTFQKIVNITSGTQEVSEFNLLKLNSKTISSYIENKDTLLNIRPHNIISNASIIQILVQLSVTGKINTAGGMIELKNDQNFSIISSKNHGNPKVIEFDELSISNVKIEKHILIEERNTESLNEKNTSLFGEKSFIFAIIIILILSLSLLFSIVLLGSLIQF